MNNFEPFKNFLWYKFSNYEWKYSEIKGDYLAPANGAEFQTYNLWEVNNSLLKQSNGRPFFGALFDIDVEKYEELLKSYRNAKDINSKITIERDFKLYKEYLKRKIKDFVCDYGMFGTFHTYVNTIVYYPELLPIFERKEDTKFSNKKPNFKFSKEITKAAPKFLGKEYWNLFKDKEKLNNEYICVGMVPYSDAFGFVKGDWRGTLTKIELTDEFYEKVEQIENNEIDYKYISDEWYNRPGIYFDWAFEGRLKLEESTSSNKEFKYDINPIGEVFLSFDYPEMEFFELNAKKEPAKKSFYSEGFWKNYTESLYSYVDFIKRLQISMKQQKVLKELTESFEIQREIIEDEKSLLNKLIQSLKEKEPKKKKYVIEIPPLNKGDEPIKYTINNQNPLTAVEIENRIKQIKNEELHHKERMASSDNLMIRLTHKNHNFMIPGHKQTPYNIHSPSLIGIIAEMNMWGELSGRNMKKCENSKCENWFFGAMNKKWCSESCRVKEHIKKKKSQKLLT